MNTSENNLIFERYVNPSFEEVHNKYKDNSNIFFTFTKEQKVGINPQSPYNTPVGIYCYPAKETWIKYTKKGDLLPLGQVHGMFVSFFSINNTSNIITDISMLQKQQFDGYFQQLENIFQKETGMNLTVKNINQSYKKLLIDLWKQGDYDYGRYDEPLSKRTLEDVADALKDITGWYNLSYGHKLWALTRDVANTIGGFGKRIEPGEEGHDVFQLVWNEDETITNNKSYWNKIFRQIGINGVIDRSGAGIIHENEPVQGVIFRGDIIDIKEQIIYKTKEEEEQDRKAQKPSNELLTKILNSTDLRQIIGDIHTFKFKGFPKKVREKIRNLILTDSRLPEFMVELITSEFHWREFLDTPFFKSLPNDLVLYLTRDLPKFYKKK